MKEYLSKENPFYKKLVDWYGDLQNKQIEVLYVDKDNEDIFAVIYIVKYSKSSMIDITRIFTLSNNMEISIDRSQIDTKTMNGIRKLIQYGGNFKRYEIQD